MIHLLETITHDFIYHARWPKDIVMDQLAMEQLQTFLSAMAICHYWLPYSWRTASEIMFRLPVTRNQVSSCCEYLQQEHAVTPRLLTIYPDCSSTCEFLLDLSGHLNNFMINFQELYTAV